MIIVCPECSTKFKIKSERLPDAGARVRCARCKHVFHADKPVEEVVVTPIATEAGAEQIVAESQVPGTTIEQPMTDAQSEPPPSAPEKAEGDTEDSAFSYDRFQELDSVEDQEESFTFASDEEPEEQAVPSASESSDSDFTFAEESEEDVSTIEKIIESENDIPDVEESLPVDSSPIKAPERPQQQVAEKKSGAVSAIIRILLVLILGILVIGGVLVYMNGPDQLNQTIQQLLGQQVERPVQTGRISLANLEGRFVQNKQAGELFLIRGEAINDFSEPRAGIQVKGVIFDPNGKPLLQKTVFCGNPISEQDLQTLSFTELEKMMGNQFGAELSNMKIEKGQSISFDIVFKDLPQNLSEFSVKVTSSTPVTK